MGNEIRRVELRVAKLEKAAAEQKGIIERLQQVIGAVAESAGSALAVEALMELAGLPAAQAKMGEVAKRKQAEAEAVMAGRVKAAVEKGQLKLGEMVGEQSLVVGERSEGASVKYRVDLHPAPKAYLGKKAGDVVEEEGSKTEIREVYEAVKAPLAVASEPDAEAPQEKAGGEILMAAYPELVCDPPTPEQVRAAAAKAKEEALMEAIAASNLAMECSPPQEILIPDVTPAEYERIVEAIAPGLIGDLQRR